MILAAEQWPGTMTADITAVAELFFFCNEHTELVADCSACLTSDQARMNFVEQVEDFRARAKPWGDLVDSRKRTLGTPQIGTPVQIAVLQVCAAAAAD